MASKKTTLYLDERMQETIEIVKTDSFQNQAVKLTSTDVIRKALELLRRDMQKGENA